MTEALSPQEVERRLGSLDAEWSVLEGKLHRELGFADFVEAFGFMTGLALVAERLDHHPDWSNSWNRVVLDIASHDAGGITEACFERAAAADRLARRAP